MSKLTLIAAALLALPAPALAQIVFEGDLTKFVPTKAEKAKSDLDHLECRAQDVLGSRLQRHQVCLTKAQWQIYDQEEKQAVHDWKIIPLSSH